eukprot:Hpha_TRINITY_DN12748_c0_g2::TRINITY_DN12748_c0_g2_i1::g.114497::m.114497/K15377/SLC44A2_4_5; solute carrier family 44 (choline transporter-like protein), member 2/4/5
MGCCGEAKSQADQDFGPKASRGCTDCWCTPVWFLACMIQFLVAWVAMKNGHPNHLIFGTDYQGDLCGSTSSFDSPNLNLQKGLQGDWSEYSYLWYPLDVSLLLKSNGDAIGGAGDVWNNAVKNAVCVKKCPRKGDIVYTYGKGKNGEEPPFSYDVEYESAATLRRCLPISVPAAVATRDSVGFEMRMEPIEWHERAIDDLTPRGAVAPIGAVDRAASGMDNGLGAWLCTSPSAICVNVPPGTYGATEDKSICESTCASSQGSGGLGLNVATQMMADIYDTLPVLGGSALLALAMGAGWLVLVRYYTYAVIMFSLLLVFFMLGGIGFLLYAHAPDAVAPKYWYYAAYIAWGTDGILMIFFLFFRKTIKIAAMVIMESGRVVLSEMRTLFIPVGTAFFSMIFTLFCALVYIYIQSMKKADMPGELAWVDYGNGTDWVAHHSHRTIQFMWWWNLFFYFWGTCFIADFAFMVLAIIGVYWYYSVESLDHQRKQGVKEEDLKQKEGPGITESVSVALFHHMGSLALGSFLVAVVKLVRFVMMKTKESIERRLGKRAAAALVCIIECMLWCIEKLVQAVTRRAYIMTAITGDSFFPSAWSALSLMLSNAVLVAATEFIETSTELIGKILMTSFGVVFCYASIEWWGFAPAGTQLYGPLLACALASYTIAGIYMNVLDTITSTILMTFMFDEADQSDDDLYMPGELKSTVGRIEKHGRVKTPFKVGEVLRLRHPSSGIKLGRKGQDLKLGKEESRVAFFTVYRTEPELEVTYMKEDELGKGLTHGYVAPRLPLPYLPAYNDGHAPHYTFMLKSHELHQNCKWYDPLLIIIFPIRLLLCMLTCGTVECLDPFHHDEDDESDDDGPTVAAIHPSAYGAGGAPSPQMGYGGGFGAGNYGGVGGGIGGGGVGVGGPTTYA